MQIQNAITNLEDLRKWFESKKTPFYTLYTGRGVSQNMVLHRQRNELSEEEAWMEIEHFVTISSYGGGVFTLVTREDKNKENILNGKTLIAINQPGMQNAGIAGINSPQIGQDAINKAVNDARQQWELEKRVEELEHSLDQSQNSTFWDRIGNRLAENEQLPQLCEALLMRFLVPSGQQQPSPSAGVHGIPGQKASLEESMQKLSTVFADPEELIHRISNWVEQHPEFAKQIFEEQILMNNE